MNKDQAMQSFLKICNSEASPKAPCQTYLLTASRFLEYCRTADVATLDESPFRDYLLELHASGSLSPVTINHHNSIIRFLYEVTLEKNINYKHIPRFKKHKGRPTAFSVGELLHFFSLINNPMHFAFFLTLYGSGLRISELASLRTDDIDSKRMLIHIREGKGNKERYTPLTEAGLMALRHYWKTYRPVNPGGYLFPHRDRTRCAGRYTFDKMFKNILFKAQISMGATPHTLRHCFATHTLQSGTDLMTLKEMLSHASISSTSVYIHLSLVDRSNKRSVEDVAAEIKAMYDLRNPSHG